MLFMSFTWVTLQTINDEIWNSNKIDQKHLIFTYKACVTFN